MSIERCDDLKQLHPALQEKAIKLIEIARQQGLKAKVIDTYRSAERQDYLYAQGRSRHGNIVTNATGKAMSSYHNWRLAFDCIQDIPGKEYDAIFLAKLGGIGQSIGLEWGGGWSGFKDSPHFQLTFGLSIKDLKAGKKPPTTVSSVEDTDLESAAQVLYKKGIITNLEAWSSLSAIKLKNVSTLLKNMGGIDRLIKDKVVSESLLWTSGTYKAEHVRSLIIKFSKIG